MIQATRDEKVVQEILEAARAIFSQYGLKKTTMDDVAKAIGKGKSTLYYYYPGKNELFEAVVVDELKKSVRLTREAINSKTTPKEKLKALVLQRFETKKHLHNLGRVIYQDIFANFERICSLKKQFEEIQVEFIKEIIVGGMQLGEFREMTADEITFFAHWAIAGFNGLVLPIYTSEYIMESDHCCDKVVDLLLYGIAKRQG